MSDRAIAKTLEQIEREFERFLYREAELLDGGHFEEWFQLLSPDIEYRVPVRTTRQKKDGEGFSTTAFFFDEDYGSLKLRVARLVSDFAWSESPPARTRRSITNVRVGGQDPAGLSLANEHAVRSNLALFSFRGESATPVVLTGERQDVVQWTDGRWRLKRRLVLLDTTILGMDSLAIFL